MANPEKGYHFEWKADDRLAETLEKLLYNELAPRSELKKRSKLAERKA